MLLLNYLMSLFTKMESIIDNIRNILRKEGITGFDSINHCIVFIFNRLLTEKICDSIGFDKIYAFDNIIKDDNGKEIGEADLAIRVWNNSKDSFVGQMITKLKYSNIKFKLQRMSEIKKIYLLLAVLDIDELHTKYDILGTIYELHLKSGSTGGGMRDLGQYYTHRSVINYMIELCKPSYENKQIESVLDPSMGTGGFLSMYIKYYNDNYKVNWSKNKKFIHGYDIDENVKNMALLNMLLESGEHMNATLKQVDTLICDLDCGKVDIILANEPMGLKGIDYKNCSDAIKKVGIKGTKAEPLFLNLMFESLKENGRCAVVVPDGILFGDSTQQKETRKYLVENFNLKKVIALDGTFFLNTGVKTSVLFFVNNGKTKKVEFCNLKLNKDETVEEEMIEKIKYDTIKENNYSLFVGKYTNKVVKMEGIKYMKLDDLCNINFGKRIKKNDVEVEKDYNGDKYPCYGGGDISFYMKEYNREGDNIIISRFALSEKCVRMVNCKFWLNDSGFTIMSKDENIINTKYLGYYLYLNQTQIYNIAVGSCQKNLQMDEFRDMTIPIIPIEKQNELVAKLDEIYENTKNTEKMIESYKKMLKYYVEVNTKNEENDVSFDDMFDMKIGKLTTNKICDNGEYDFYNGSANSPLYKHNEYSYDKNEKYLLLIKDGGAGEGKYGDSIGLGKVFFVEGKTAFTSSVVALSLKTKDKIKYCYYYITSIKNEIMDNARYTVGLGHVSTTLLKKIKIKVPSIEKQQEIIEYCDKLNNTIEIMYEILQTNKQMMEQYINNEFNNNEKDVQENDIVVKQKKKIIKKKPIDA